MIPSRISVKVLLAFIILSSITNTSYAQNDSSLLRKSIIRGSIIDANSKQPIVHARIGLKGTKLGALSGDDGTYRISNVPVGHYVIQVSASGYSISTQEVLVSSARQAVINFEMKEIYTKGDSVTIFGSGSLDAINRNVAVSVTPFSIQDVNRYAAAFQDPSRMAQNFAGVFGRGTTNNYIVVRGGSPIELLWRLDGIDIPNPNHFGKNGSSGGLISAINSSMLGNSDFLTGAFPAEYGTKLSAVFDLHTRDGNTEKPEGMVEVSFNGLEAMAESPMPFASGSSVLVSYRHSTLDLLRQIGILDYDQLPDFDDAMLKLHLKLGDDDIVNATGLWGSAALNVRNTTSEEIGKGSGILVGGIDWQHIYSDNLIGHIKLSSVKNSFDEGINGGIETTALVYKNAKADLSYYPITSQNISVGVTYQRASYQLFPHILGFNGDTTIYSDLLQGYINWNWHIIPELVLNTGIYYQSISFDSSSSFEPRASISWSPTLEHTFSAAFGVHRQPEPLKFAEAKHYVLGYSYRPDQDLLFKLEGYIKDYSDVPIHSQTKDSYSFLNQGFAERIEFADLINQGTGKSYGAELSILKHYSDGYYITATASYVRQEFTGSDGILHWGEFDNRYILNLLAGYDIPLSASSTLTLSEKCTLAGGGAYTPYDIVASRDAGYGIYDSTKVYAEHADPYFRVDINAEFHFNWAASSFTVYASVLNAFNITNHLYRFFSYANSSDGYVRYEDDLPIIPIIGLRYEF